MPKSKSVLSFSAALLAPIALLASNPASAQSSKPISSAEARLEVCLDLARTDPTSAISQSSQWLGEEAPPYTSRPQQCLGTAYMSLLRWQAAQTAFLAARDDRPSNKYLARAKLGAMAGNAALAGEEFEDALAALDIAQGEAANALNNDIAGEIAADRARALVALGRSQEARSALVHAREMMPQSAMIWLLSATLERRLGEVETAQTLIVTAKALAPADDEIGLEIGLEAGLVAALSGRDEAARKSWNSLVTIAPDSHFASQARAYLAQLDDMPPAQSQDTP